MSDLQVDPAIERIEAELRVSRSQAWDVETFLANRHRAKIEALTGEPDKPWARRWAATKEVSLLIAAFFGYFSIIAGLGRWLVTGTLYLPPFSFG